MGHSVTLKAVCGVKKPEQKSFALTLDKNGLLKQGGFVVVLVSGLIRCEVRVSLSLLALARECCSQCIALCKVSIFICLNKSVILLLKYLQRVGSTAPLKLSFSLAV